MANVSAYTMTGLFKTKIHGPSFSGKAMYVQKADYNSGEKSDQELANSLKDAAYLKASEKNLNSPTNIRRVFVTHKKVIVEHYAAPKVNGARSTLVSVRPIAEFDSIVKKWIESKLLSPSQAAFSTNANKEKVKINGGLSQALEYYKCSNIEEIYFDWSVLATDDLSEFVNVAFNKGEYQDIQPVIVNHYMQKGNYTGSISGNEALAIFLANKQKLIYKYDRLRAVGFISNLDDIDIKNTIERFHSNNDTSGKLWIENPEVLNYIVQSKSDCWLTTLKAAKVGYDNLDKFEIKKTQFVFDELYLEPKLASYVNKFKEEQAANGYTAQKAKEAEKSSMIDNLNTVEGSLDELVVSIKKDVGEKELKKILRMAFRAVGKEASNAEIGQMDKELYSYVNNLITKK